MSKLTESRDQLNESLKIIERRQIMSGVMPLDELLDRPAVINFFAVLPMGPDHANPIHLFLGSSRESDVRLPCQQTLQSFDPAGPVLCGLEFDDQDRPECEGRCG